jgi:D-sedoheptulose 7-phosphate isomerase
VNKLELYVDEIFKNSIVTKQEILNTGCAKVLVPMALGIYRSITNGGKLLLCGNGGSAADAQHLAAELLIRLRSHVERVSLPALSLAMDSSTLTACGNDFSFDDIFARPLQGLGNKGDILLGITTSGKSKNVIKAFEVAKEKGIACYGFLGGDGGPALKLCDLAFIAPSTNTARIQEAHITAGHALMDMVEDLFLSNGNI